MTEETETKREHETKKKTKRKTKKPLTVPKAAQRSELEQRSTTYEFPTTDVQPRNMGPEVVATSLAPQLGSETGFLAQGKVDMRKLSVIEERDIPMLIYAKVRGKKSPVWDLIADSFLNLKVSVGGRGRKDIIRMEGVSKGGLPDLQPEFE
jgi:hypothetical protein